MLPTIADLHTGAGANLIRYEAIATPWNARITYQPDPALGRANGTKLQWRGVFPSQIQLDEVVVTVSFGVVLPLSVKCILGTLVIDSCICRISPLKNITDHTLKIGAHPYRRSILLLPATRRTVHTRSHGSRYESTLQ